MEKRMLGKTGLEVTVLGYGAMALKGNPIPVNKDDTANEAWRLLNGLLDSGVNFIDTSPDYGSSEEIIGQAISHRRDEFYLATKCGCNIPPPEKGSKEGTHLWTKQMLLKNIDLSLQRMKTDHVDIWQMHNPKPDVVQEADLVAAMEEVKKQGKVRHVSISSTLPALQSYIDWGVFETFQIPYSGLERQHEEAISAAAKAGAGIIIRGGVAKGEPGESLESNKRWKPWVQANLDELCSEGESRSAFLLRFTISHPDMHTTIVGTRNPAHLEENLRAVQAGPLPQDVYAEAKRRLEGVGQKPESLA